MHPQPARTGIDHVSLLALNLERTVQFYRDVLGLRIVDPVRDDARSAPDRVWLGDDRRRVITITQSPDGRPGELGIGTIHHVALHYVLDLGSPEALHDQVTSLSMARMEVTPVLDEAGSPAVSVPDPDGQIIDLVTADPRLSTGEPAGASHRMHAGRTADPASASRGKRKDRR